MKQPPILWPPPRNVRWDLAHTCRIPKSAACAFPRSREFEAACSLFPEPLTDGKSWAWPQAARGASGGLDAFVLRRATASETAWLSLRIARGLGADAFSLAVSPTGITAEAGSVGALHHAVELLLQLVWQCGSALPCLEVEDAPALERRGFMLDISRCKVPNAAYFDALRGLLRTLRVNEFQAYTEHTFAFPGHEAVWADSSPLTAADVFRLQDSFASAGIELVPNLNSFGHLERWLKHPQYRHLAECPDGFVHPISKQRLTNGTTLYPSARSLAFLDGLYRDFLPHFRSPLFNIGGDEPWELGEGRSARRCAKHGKHRVYLDFLKEIHALAARHGRRIQFWADILLQAPELVADVPLDATPVIWGYEASHPFAVQCAQVAAAGRRFYVAPGSSTWLSFTGRWENMLANVAEAARQAHAHGGTGYLLTSWGDLGNHQPAAAMLPSLVLGLGAAWNPAGFDATRAVDAVNLALRAAPEAPGATLGELLRDLGRVEDGFSNPRPNRSRLHAVFFAANPEEMEKAMDGLVRKELELALERAQAVSTRARGGVPAGWGVPSLDRPQNLDLALGADMAAWAARRALASLRGKKDASLRAELPLLIGRFEDEWVKTARAGGLHEASCRMRRVLDTL